MDITLAELRKKVIEFDEKRMNAQNPHTKMPCGLLTMSEMLGLRQNTTKFSMSTSMSAASLWTTTSLIQSTPTVAWSVPPLLLDALNLLPSAIMLEIVQYTGMVEFLPDSVRSELEAFHLNDDDMQWFQCTTCHWVRRQASPISPCLECGLSDDYATSEHEEEELTLLQPNAKRPKPPP